MQILEKKKKQLLAVESKVDPRFGFSIMKAKPFGMIGDIEDPHILFDSLANKWRMLTCKNINGYKAIVLESDHWNRELIKKLQDLFQIILLAHLFKKLETKDIAFQAVQIERYMYIHILI